MADYVKATVAEAVAEGLTAVIKAAPSDPVDFLGRFITHYADHLEALKKAEAGTATARAAAESAVRAAAAAEAAEATRPAVIARRKLEDAESGLLRELEAVEEVDDAFLGGLSQRLAALLGVNVYIAEKDEAVNPATGEAGPIARYLAASEGSEHLLQERIADADAAIFDAWVPLPPPATEEGAGEGGEEAEEAEEGAEAPPPPPPPPPSFPTIHIPNVLRGLPPKKMVFHDIPRPGAFAAVPLQYPNALHPDALKLPAAGGEGGEGAEGGPAPALGEPPAELPLRSLALCADSMGRGGRDFTPEELAFLKRLAESLQAALARSERALYAKEFKSAHVPMSAEAEAAALATAQSVSENIRKAGEDAAATETSGQPEPPPEDVLQQTRGGATIAAVLTQLHDYAAFLIDFAERRIRPPEAAQRVLQAVFLALGKAPEDLVEPGVADPTTAAPSWPRLRALLRPADAFMASLKALDPAKPSRVMAYANPTALRALCDAAALEDLVKGTTSGGAGCPALPVLQAWVRAVADVREGAAAQRQRILEEEERKKKEAEEAAAAAAED